MLLDCVFLDRLLDTFHDFLILLPISGNDFLFRCFSDDDSLFIGCRRYYITSFEIFASRSLTDISQNMTKFKCIHFYLIKAHPGELSQ